MAGGRGGARDGRAGGAGQGDANGEAMVDYVLPGGALDAAGIRVGDVLLKVRVGDVLLKGYGWGTCSSRSAAAHGARQHAVHARARARTHTHTHAHTLPATNIRGGSTAGDECVEWARTPGLKVPSIVRVAH